MVENAEETPSGGAIPQQERSRRRYHAILDAGGTVFAARGVEGATMQEIAALADTSIGSVYRFFPDKRALFVALVDRVVGRDEEVLDDLFATAFEEPLADLIDAAVDRYAALQRDEPGWSAIWMNLHLYGDLCEADRQLAEKQISRLELLIAHHAPALTSKRRNVAATTILNLMTGMLSMTARCEDPSMQRSLLNETKAILRMYAAQQIAAPRERDIKP